MTGKESPEAIAVLIAAQLRQRRPLARGTQNFQTR